MISDVLKTIITELPEAVQEPFKDNYLADYIRGEAKDIIKQNAPKKYQDYFYKGSAGQGAWVKNKDAWIGIFNPEITNGAKQGYYLAYAFPIGSNFVRFGIGQGFTEAQEQYGAKNWEQALDRHADLMRLKIPSYASRFNLDPVKPSMHDGKSYYGAGYVYLTVYDVTNLPDETELVKDLEVMLDAYEELFQNGGRNLDKQIDKPRSTLTSFEDNEDNYQNPPPKKTFKNSPKTAEISDGERKKAKGSISNSRPRNPDFGEEAKQRANYKCEIGPHHPTFRRRTDEKGYTEAHHLIPYEQYDYFANNGLCLDRSFNIVSLCPNCHRKIHHGKKDDIGNLLEKLFESRGQALINFYACDLETLKGFYKI